MENASSEVYRELGYAVDEWGGWLGVVGGDELDQTR